MDMAPGLPPIQPKTGDLAQDSLPSDSETHDLAPAGPLPSERPSTAHQSRHA